MADDAVPAGATYQDRVLSFTIPERDTRGRAVRLGPVLEQVLSAHAYPLTIRRLLAEALVLTVLMGSLLKDDDSQLTLQVQTETGVIDLLVCDYRKDELRGYVRFDNARFDAVAASTQLCDLFGNGYLAITFDLATAGQRYQGIVPLEGESLAEACQSYFIQSEQVPTLIRISVEERDGHCIAGGLLLQHLPEGEEGRERLHARMDHPHWEHVSIMASSTTPQELGDTSLSLEDLIWRLFHEEHEVRVAQGLPLVRGCRCNQAHYRTILSRFAQSDLDDMRDEHGVIAVDCAFCSKVFPIDL